MSKPASWQNRLIAHEKHADDLELASAVNEFHGGMQRKDAEDKAYGDYRRKQAEEAAAQHLRGMHLARTANDKEMAARHRFFFDVHMRAAGHNPAAEPPAVAQAAADPELNHVKFKAHPADSLPLVQKAESWLDLEALEKSKNVREQKRAMSDDSRKVHLNRFLTGLAGFRYSKGRRDQFGQGPDQRGITYNYNVGSPGHETGHALMTPVGQTLRQHQQALAGPTAKKPLMPQKERRRIEFGAFKLEPMLERRAGVETRESRFHRENKWARNGGAHRSNEDKDPGATAQGRIDAHRELGAFEEGRKVIDKKGLVKPGTSLDAKINARGLGKSENYNGMGLVDPAGKFHSTDGLSHPDWCHENRHLVGWQGTRTLGNDGYEPAEGDEALYDQNENIALDAFKDAGWIRVKPGAGIELSYLHPGNVGHVRNILSSMGRSSPGRKLYVDDGNGSLHLDVDHRGRVDFRPLAGRIQKSSTPFSSDVMFLLMKSKNARNWRRYEEGNPEKGPLKGSTK